MTQPEQHRTIRPRDMHILTTESTKPAETRLSGRCRPEGSDAAGRSSHAEGSDATGRSSHAEGSDAAGRSYPRRLLRRWYVVFFALFFLGSAALYLLVGENAHIAVHDNLELFQTQYQMMRNQSSFFSRGSAAAFLGGVSRDLLPSELSLTTLLYALLPSAFSAYIVNWFLKILLAMLSFYLLADELLYSPRRRRSAPPPVGTRAGNRCSPRAHCSTDLDPAEKDHDHGDPHAHRSAPRAGKAMPMDTGEKGIILLCGFAYGILNVFPNFGIPFAVIPLYLWLMLRLVRAEGRRQTLLYLLALFAYPFVSYFSYFGLFLLAYSAAALVILWIARRRFPRRLFLGILAMSCGCVVFEYRLFGQMLFSDTVTIRSSFVAGDLSAPQIAAEIWDVFLHGIFHADGEQTKLVLPLCCLFAAAALMRRIASAFGGKLTKSVKSSCTSTSFSARSGRLLFWCGLLLGFNAVVYGLYNFAPFRTAIETLLPPLTGWQFNRTVFFSPFLWYAVLCILCLRLYHIQGCLILSLCGKVSARLLCLAAVAVILLDGSKYNDLYSTARALVQERRTGQPVNELSYHEFFSPELFETIKADLDYQPGRPEQMENSPSREIENGAEQVSGKDGTDWAAAYGLNPAILEYNGIATLDGYLGFYPQSYKDAFRRVIAPALERRPATAAYYDEWGARCFLYSGDEDTIVQAVRNYQTVSNRLYIDADALRSLGCRYLFSRISLSNAEELGLSLRGIYADAGSPYTIYVYDAGVE